MNHCEFEPDGTGWTCRLCGWQDRPHPKHPRKTPTVKNCPAKRSPSLPNKKPSGPPPPIPPGAGTHLHRLLKTITGENINPGCGCSSRIAEMNACGPGWCRDNVEQIVDWLIEEVERRLKAAEDAQESAGWRLRLGGLNLPGRRLLLRRLVLVAVRWAERTLSLENTKR